MYFRNFPKLDYDFNRTGSINQMVDIFRSVKPLPSFVDTFTGYRTYTIENGERPDIISTRLYGRPDLYWTFFVVNEFLHDGYRAWPMSQEDLYSYMQKEYEGYVIEIRTKSRDDENNPGNFETVNSIAGKFQINEVIRGLTSGAAGKLKKKNVDMNQLIVQEWNSIPYIGNMHLNGGALEVIRGDTTFDTVDSFRTFAYADAPYYYYSATDSEKKPVTNAIHVAGGVPNSDLEFQTYREFEFERNAERSKIRFVDNANIEKFVDRFFELINV